MPRATESNDELLARLERGSSAVFYGRHVEDLVAFFMRRTRNAELAADLTAETFAAALVARTRLDPGRGSGSAWLYGIALRKLARVSGDRAATILSNDEIVQLRRIATGEWPIDRMGPFGAVGSFSKRQRAERQPN